MCIIRINSKLELLILITGLAISSSFFHDQHYQINSDASHNYSNEDGYDKVCKSNMRKHLNEIQWRNQYLKNVFKLTYNGMSGLNDRRPQLTIRFPILRNNLYSVVQKSL